MSKIWSEPPSLLRELPWSWPLPFLADAWNPHQKATLVYIPKCFNNLQYIYLSKENSTSLLSRLSTISERTNNKWWPCVDLLCTNVIHEILGGEVYKRFLKVCVGYQGTYTRSVVVYLTVIYQSNPFSYPSCSGPSVETGD